jgi:hypothetical protein
MGIPDFVADFVARVRPGRPLRGYGITARQPHRQTGQQRGGKVGAGPAGKGAEFCPFQGSGNVAIS